MFFLINSKIRGRSLHQRVDECSKVIAIAMMPEKRRNSNESEVEFACELVNGRTIPIRGTEDQMKELTMFLERGYLVSAESSLKVSSVASNDVIANLPSGKLRVNRGTGMHRQPYPEAVRRDLASDDPKSILAVRVTDSDGRVHPDTADLISDQIFGTNGDTLTMTSQLAACSYGKFNVTNEYPAGMSQLFSAPGVIDVQMNVPLSGTDRFDIGNAARYALEELLGFQLPGPFHNVMFIYESCYTDCGWAGESSILWLLAFTSRYQPSLCYSICLHQPLDELLRRRQP